MYSTSTKLGGRGPGRHVKEEFSLGPPEGESIIGTVIVRIVPKPDLSDEERKIFFDRFTTYCQTHHVVPHWRLFPVQGYVCFLRIYDDTRVFKRLQQQVSRLAFKLERPTPRLLSIPAQLRLSPPTNT